MLGKSKEAKSCYRCSLGVLHCPAGNTASPQCKGIMSIDKLHLLVADSQRYLLQFSDLRGTGEARSTCLLMGNAIRNGSRTAAYL